MDSVPVDSVELSPAQQHVLVAVKRRGEASADAVAEAVGTTPSAVRQHLAALKSGGFVASRQERGRSGRPVDLYHGTELGESLFAGRSAVDLSVELLGHLQDEDPELVSLVFERRRQRRDTWPASTSCPAIAIDSRSTAVPSGRWPPASVRRAPPSSNSCRSFSRRRK